MDFSGIKFYENEIMLILWNTKNPWIGFIKLQYKMELKTKYENIILPKLHKHLEKSYRQYKNK